MVRYIIENKQMGKFLADLSDLASRFTGIDERTDEYNDEYRDKDKVSGQRFTQDCENFQCDNNANTAIIELIHKSVCFMKNLKK